MGRPVCDECNNYNECDENNEIAPNLECGRFQCIHCFDKDKQIKQLTKKATDLQQDFDLAQSQFTMLSEMYERLELSAHKVVQLVEKQKKQITLMKNCENCNHHYEKWDICFLDDRVIHIEDIFQTEKCQWKLKEDPQDA